MCVFILLLALTPSSDAKQLEFYEDRSPKCLKTDVQSRKNNSLKDAVVRESVSDGILAACDNVEKNSSEALPSEMSREDVQVGTGLNEDKVGYQLPVAPGSSPKTSDAVATLIGHTDAGNLFLKEEVYVVLFISFTIFLEDYLGL